jgi:uncharacterized Zn-finger protein
MGEKKMEKTFREIEENKYECLRCLKIIGKKSNILKHIKSHNHCSKCGKEFSGRHASGNLKQHENICAGPKKLHFCQFCSKQFKLNWLVVRHEKRCPDVHEKICRGPKKLHFCQYCAKQFKLNWLVVRHEKGCPDRPG